MTHAGKVMAFDIETYQIELIEIFYNYEIRHLLTGEIYKTYIFFLSSG